MARLITDHWILYNDAFLPAGTHVIEDKDVEAMRPYGRIIEDKPVEVKPVETKQGKKTTKKAVKDDLMA